MEPIYSGSAPNFASNLIFEQNSKENSLKPDSAIVRTQQPGISSLVSSPDFACKLLNKSCRFPRPLSQDHQGA